MTNKEILQNVIRKAIKNGYKMFVYSFSIVVDTFLSIYHEKRELRNINEIIFDIEFLKAYFGEKTDTLKSGADPIWQYHAKKLSILTNDERIKYLESWL